MVVFMNSTFKDTPKWFILFTPKDLHLFSLICQSNFIEIILFVCLFGILYCVDVVAENCKTKNEKKKKYWNKNPSIPLCIFRIRTVWACLKTLLTLKQCISSFRIKSPQPRPNRIPFWHKISDKNWFNFCLLRKSLFSFIINDSISNSFVL